MTLARGTVLFPAAAGETTWTAAVATTDVVDMAGGWLSLSVAWVAGAVAGAVVLILTLIVCVIVVISRRLKSSRRCRLQTHGRGEARRGAVN